MKQNLDTILEKWNLLKHPFYQAWSAGTLPVGALQVYAREYGNFISSLPRAWETLKDSGTAAEEREHAEMWTDFTAAVGGFTADASLPQTLNLVRASDALFATRATALGAMYAFEAAGQVESISAAIECLRRKGVCAIATVPKMGEPYAQTLLPLLVGGKSLLSVLEGDSVPDLFIPQLADFYLAGQLPLDRLTTNYAFADIAHALDDAHHARVIKPVLQMA